MADHNGHLRNMADDRLFDVAFRLQCRAQATLGIGCQSLTDGDWRELRQLDRVLFGRLRTVEREEHRRFLARLDANGTRADWDAACQSASA